MNSENIGQALICMSLCRADDDMLLYESPFICFDWFPCYSSTDCKGNCLCEFNA